MRKTENSKFSNFLHKTLRKFKPRFSFHYVAYTLMFFVVVFSVVHLVGAATPNPGHPWIEIGDGNVIFSDPGTPRTYTLPNANATILTTNAAVTAAQGGTGFSTYAVGDLLYADTTTTLAKLADVATGSCLISGGVSTAPSWGSCTSGGIAWSAITNPTTTQSLTFDDTEINTWTVSSDTETFQTISSSTLTSGTLLSLVTTGTGALTGQKGLNISLSGANGTGAQTTYGAYLSNTKTGTSNNVGLYATASGGSNNYAAIFEAGNVGIGTTSPSTALHVVKDSSGTNTIQDVLTIGANSTGTAANNFGTGILFQGETTTTNNRDMAKIDAYWSDATDASRTSKLSFKLLSNTQVMSEYVSMDNTFGSNSRGAINVGNQQPVIIRNDAITTGTSYTIGNSSQTLTLSSSSTATSPIVLTSSGTTATNGVEIGGTSYVLTTLAKNALTLDDSYTVASGSGVLTAINIANTYNLTSTASGAQIGININPTLTSLASGTYRGINIPYSNSAAYGVYQSGASTLNYFNGNTGFGDSSPASLLTVGSGDLFQINSSGDILTPAAENLSITTGTTGSLTLDSGTTGTVNLATGNNAKTINIGTGTAGNTLNIGTNNTTLDAINIGSALDTLTYTGNSSSAFVLNAVNVSAAEFNVLDAGIELGDLTTQGTATDEYCLTSETGGGALLAWQACGGGASWDAITNPAGTQTLTFDDGELNAWTVSSDTETFHTITANSLTTGKVLSIASSSLTTGSLIDLAITGTAASVNQTGLNISLSGANASLGVDTYGIKVSNTHTDGSSIAQNTGVYASTTGQYGYSITGTNSGGGVGVSGAITSSTNFGAAALSGSVAGDGYGAQVASTRSASTGNFAATLESTTTGTFNTAGGAADSYAGYFSSTTTRSAGANALTNIGLYATASGAQNNYSAIFDAGNVGIGDTSPTALLTVGASDVFQVNSSGAIAASTGIISTKSITDTGSIVDLNLTLGNDANADTVSALNIDVTSVATGADGDSLYGINVANLTSADADVAESALFVGTGWDKILDTGALDISQAGVISGATGLTSSGTITFSSISGSTQCLQVNSSGVVSGTGSACGSGGGLTVGTTTITSGTGGNILYNNAGILGEMTTTGSGTVVALATSPSITTSLVTGSTSFDLVNTTATTLNIGGAATTFALGGTPTTTLTANLFTNATAAATTKTINLGTGAAASSTTNINIGSANGGTTTINSPTTALGTGSITMTGSLGTTGARLTKGWFTDLEVTNAIVGSITGSAPTLTTSRNLWGQSFNGSADVTGSLSSVGDITGGASSMIITAGTGNSRTMTLRSTTAGGTATAFLTGNADQSSTFGGNISGTGSWTLTGGAGNMTITAGTGNSRTMALQSTTAGGTATTFLTGNADQSATFANVVTGGNFTVNATTVPVEGMYRPTGAGNLGFSVSSAAELLLTSTAFSPAADGGNSLGTTALGWQNLFGNTGFVLNIENGDWVATHTAGILTVGTGDLRVTTAGTNSASVVTVGGTQTLTGKTINLSSNTLSGTTAEFNTALSDNDFATLAGSETLSNKTLTAPKFADLGFIADANGNELIILDTTTSAVNEWTLANGATGVNPKLTASGEANVGLDFQVKGTGVYNLLATASGPTDLRLFEDTDNGSNYASLIATGNMSGDRVITLPNATTQLIGTDTADTLTNKNLTSGTNTFPTFNQDTTGSALSLKSNATTGLMQIVGPGVGTTRVKTIRDANDTILELGGSYTPTGTWTSLNLNEAVALTTTSTKLNYLTSATGTTGTTSTNVVFSTSPALTTPTVVTSIVGSASFDAFNTVSTTLNIGGAATTFALGGTPTTTLTANLFTNATAAATTKTINLGTGAAASSTTNINIGSANGGTTTINSPTTALGTGSITMTGSLGTTGARLTKGWFTDLEVTNAIVGSITGNAATVTTNANLTGAVTSSGNATSLGSFTLAALSTAVSDADIARTDAGQTFTGVNTFTSPKILTDISDTNGNELVKFTATGSAINEFTITNAATGTNPQLSATGGGTDVGLDFLVKGAGVYRLLATTSGPADLRLFEDADNGTNYVSFIAPASLAGNQVLTLPDATDTLVGKATTDVFTNKTLTSSTNVLGGVTMTLGSDANYDTYYRNSSGVLTRLANGSTGNCLNANTGAAPSWGSCGGGSTNWDTIGDAGGDGAIAMGATVQTMDWATASTQAAMTFNANSLTTGQLLTLSSTNAITTTGKLLSVSGNTATTTTGLATISATGLTTGFAQALTLGTALTTGGALNITGASYNPGAGNTGSLASLSFTNAGSNTSGANIVNGINVSSTVNTSGATGTKQTNAINVASPTLTGCTGGTCSWYGLNITAPTTASNINSTAISITASSFSKDNTSATGVVSAVAGLYEDLTFTDSAGKTQVGNRMVISNAPTTNANTSVGQIIRTTDNTSLANTVRGIEIVSSVGSNVAGTNTGLRATGATFGVQGLTTGLAGDVVAPAALYGEMQGTTQGDALRLYSTTITSSPQMAYFYHSTSTFTGTGLLMDMATGSGTFSGNFVDFQNNNTSKFKVDSSGQTTLTLDGTASTSAVCGSHSTGTSGDQTGVMLTDCSGAPAADYAEMYPVENDTEYGDIVTTGSELINTYDTTNGNIDWNKIKGKITKLVKSNSIYQKNVVGIVVDNHGDFTSSGYNLKETDNPMPVALNGRVPVKVASDSDNIMPGDYITTSNESGKATKAKKAGAVIGKALEVWTRDSGAKTVMVYVEQGFYNGEAVSQFAGIDPLSSDLSKQALKKFMQSSNNMYLNSEILTDRVSAGLEVITPKLIADNVSTNIITSSTGESIGLVISDSGKFTIGGTINRNGDGTSSITNPAITFDNLGNATFNGKITAKEIQVSDLSGIEDITNQINQLAEGQIAFNLTAQAMNALTGAITLAQTNINNIKNDISLTNQKVEGLTVLGADIDNRLKAIESVFASNAFNNLTSISTSALVVQGQAQFDGSSIFNGEVKFGNQTEFNVPPLFNKNTAGYALIKQGDRRARIEFSQPYIATPVVNTSVTFETTDNVDDAEASTLFSNDVRFVIVGKDQTGFTILLNKNAPRDVRFSWNALAVKDPSIFESVFEGLIIDPTIPVDENPPVDNTPPAGDTPPTDTPPADSGQGDSGNGGGDPTPPADEGTPPSDDSTPPPSDNSGGTT